MRALRFAWLALFATAFTLAPIMIEPSAAQSKDGEAAANDDKKPSSLAAQIKKLSQAGKYSEAGRVAEQLAAQTRKRYGEKHPAYAAAILRQAQMYRQQRRYGEAEPLMRRALEIYESTHGPNDVRAASALLGLGQVLRRTHRIAEADAMLRRALTIQESSFGSEDLRLSSTLNSLAIIQRQRRNYAEAETLYRRSLDIHEKAHGPENATLAIRLSNLANLLMTMNRLAEAEPLAHRAIAITQKALGRDHPQMALMLNTLARLWRGSGRPEEAEPLYRRILAIHEKNFGPRHPSVGSVLSTLAALHADRGDWAGAVELGRRMMPIVTGTRQQSDADARKETAGGSEGDEQAEGEEDEQSRPQIDANALADRTHVFRAHARALLRAAPDDRKAQSEAFEAAQWAMQTAAADALAQMSLRFAKGSGTLGALVRERQDLLGRRAAEDRRLLGAIGQNDANTVQEARKILNSIDGQLDLVDDKLARDYKEFAELSTPQPLSVADTQALLRTNEALVLFVDVRGTQKLREETLALLVTREASRFVSIPLGSRLLNTYVAALRCGLDDALWIDATDWPQATEEGVQQRKEQLQRRERCHALVKAAPRTEFEGLIPIHVLPFNLERAHELYKALFGPIEELIKDKQLLVVPSGSLTALPFHVLVTERPPAPFPARNAGYADAAWLTKQNAITVLPSVGSLRAVRAFAKTSNATSSFIGIGNPLLTGPAGTDKRAWTRLSCAQMGPPSVQIASRGMPGLIPRLFGGDLAEVELVRRQQPLPETADELCAVAKSAGAPDTSVLLGEEANEGRIKKLSADGTLGNARIVHFATHGLLASEGGTARSSATEPALVLTPPSQASEENDGLLTASEVAQLKLDADWVVLSACNTAAGDSDNPGTETLSGLARAFFYAGARALLVSHWAVDSQAAVSVVTKAFDQMSADTSVGRAEALRQSMLTLLGSNGRNAHPAVWAPFVVVGEGAR